jgi:hypothetical protein
MHEIVLIAFLYNRLHPSSTGLWKKEPTIGVALDSAAIQSRIPIDFLVMPEAALLSEH